MVAELINKKKTIQMMIEYSNPILLMIEKMFNKNENFFYQTEFEFAIKETLKNAKIILDGDRPKYVSLKNAYNINNLKFNGFIIIDEEERKVRLVSWLMDMFDSLNNYKHKKPITNRSFKSLDDSLKSLLQDSSKFIGYSDIDKELFIEDVNTFLNNAKETFDSNKEIITKQADNLSKYIDDDTYSENKRELMLQIIKLNDKYIEPFYDFLKTINENKNKGFMDKMKRLKGFFKLNKMLDEELLLSKFIINFSSYYKDIKIIYDKINEYRRKGKEDLILFNAIESAFNELSTLMVELKNGRQTNKYIDSTNFANDIHLFDGLKQNNYVKNDIQVNYDTLVNNIDSMYDTYLVEDKNKEQEIKTKEINIHDFFLNENKEKIMETIKIKNIEDKINTIIRKYKKSIIQKDEKIDMLKKIDFILRKNMDEYNVFYSLYAYSHIREFVKETRTGFNENTYLFDKENNIKYKYRAVYSMMEI